MNCANCDLNWCCWKNQNVNVDCEDYTEAEE